MKKSIFILFSLFILFSCNDDDDQVPQAGSCTGQVCTATLGNGETAATLPSSTVGVYRCVVTFAEPSSPFPLGTKGTFEVTTDQKLIVTIEGKECITLENPLWRFGATAASGNYTFRDACRDNLAYNLSFDASGTFNEVNMEFPSGPGFYGQFTLE
ncbi:hypothetical protein [Algoriphagus namhaensis]